MVKLTYREWAQLLFSTFNPNKALRDAPAQIIIKLLEINPQEALNLAQSFLEEKLKLGLFEFLGHDRSAIIKLAKACLQYKNEEFLDTLICDGLWSDYASLTRCIKLINSELGTSL